MSDMDAYKDIFLSESAEFIQGITDGLLALESQPDDLEPVETIFRGAHSLKGMAATMGYSATADLTHKMESLMDRVRKRERTVDRDLVDLMLEAVDAVRDLIDAESSGSGEADASALTERIVAATDGGGAPAAAQPGAAGPDAPVGEPAAEPADTEPHIEDLTGELPVEGSSANLFRVTCVLEDGCVLKAVRAYMVIKRLSHMGTVVDTVPDGRQIEDEEFDREFAVILSTSTSEAEVRTAATAVSEIESCTVERVAEESVARSAAGHSDERAVARDPRATPRTTAIPKLSETQTVRIAIGHLDTMVNLVGELVILRARLERIASELELHDLDDTIEELHRVAAELQHTVMHTRMVPVGNIFNRFPRMARDLARDLGKDVAFEMDGLDIELDRTVLDEIGDPIVHLLRNSIDHGIELPAERAEQGKPERGTVRLTASRERDRVRIAVSDDGRGIDCDRVWDKACQLGLAEDTARSSYTDTDVLLFTCVPGFSTAAQATKVSGRGVGMDVVKGKIEHLGGSLAISSKPGEGTEFALTLPLTLAIIQALLVESGDETFAVPLSSVDEVLSPGDLSHDTMDGAPVVIDRDGEVVPLHHLSALFGYEGDPMRQPAAGERIVLLDSNGQSRALVVEKLLGRQEVVIKPLSRMFSAVRGVGGATVLGDGRVALIIDPRSVFPGREEVV